MLVAFQGSEEFLYENHLHTLGLVTQVHVSGSVLGISSVDI